MGDRAMIEVDREVMIQKRLSPWVTTSFLATPGTIYDASLAHRGGRMAKFEIQFVYSPVLNRQPETVEADFFEDREGFIDFVRNIDGDNKRIARYRSGDIQRILRTEN
jgi:hypothetical protein